MSEFAKQPGELIQPTQLVEQLGELIQPTQLVEQLGEQPTEQPTEQLVEQPAEQPTEQPTEQLVEQPAEQPAEQPVEQPAEQPVEQPVEQNIIITYLNITSNQIQQIIATNTSNIISNQDFMHKVSAILNIIYELYKVMISSFLIIFVPQDCGDHMCTVKETFVTSGSLYTGGLVINFLTMGALLICYLCEIIREYKLITYLDVNPILPSDSVSVGNALKLLDKNKKNEIYSIDRKYHFAGWSALIMYITNIIISGVVIYHYYWTNQTIVSYITNILFMFSKLSNIYFTVNTDKNIFYSAYNKCRLQYNDIDPEEINNPEVNQVVYQVVNQV